MATFTCNCKTNTDTACTCKCKDTDCFLFYYNKKKLFADCQALTAFLSRNISTEQSVIDDYLLTDDEETLFAGCLTRSLATLTDSILDLTAEICCAVIGDADSDANNLDREAGEYIDIYLRNNGAYNANVIAAVDTALHDCLAAGAVAEFYLTSVNKDLLAIAAARRDSAMAALDKRLLTLRKCKM